MLLEEPPPAGARVRLAMVRCRHSREHLLEMIAKLALPGIRIEHVLGVRSGAAQTNGSAGP